VEKASYPVSLLCRVLEVSRAGFYAWSRRPESKHSREDRRLSVMIKAFHEESRRTYGSPRVHMDLIERRASGSPARESRV
jgi:putative transposase